MAAACQDHLGVLTEGGWSLGQDLHERRGEGREGGVLPAVQQCLTCSPPSTTLHMAESVITHLSDLTLLRFNSPLSPQSL